MHISVDFFSSEIAREISTVQEITLQETTELMKELREKKARIEDKKRQYLTKKPEGMEEHLARLSATEDHIVFSFVYFPTP